MKAKNFITQREYTQDINLQTLEHVARSRHVPNEWAGLRQAIKQGYKLKDGAQPVPVRIPCDTEEVIEQVYNRLDFTR
jgi:hypothetical protein